MPKVKVLIVEDSTEISEMYQLAFNEAGYEVYTASNGLDAIDSFKKNKPDIVLLDIMIPDLDGHEVLAEIRSNLEKYTPVIMLTNLNIEHFNKRDSIDSVDAYLVKSNYTPTEIIQKTEEVLKANQIIT